MDDRVFELWDVPRSDTVTFEELSSHIHPADRDRVRAAFAATRAVVGAYEIDFRSWWATRFGGYRLEARATTQTLSIG